MKIILRWCALSVCAVVSIVTLLAAEYSVVDLGPGVARGINNSGVVAGYDSAGGFTYDTIHGRQATPPLTVYLPDDPSQPPPYGPYFSLIQVQWTAINDSGLLVGSAVMSNRFQSMPPFQDLSPYPLIWNGSDAPTVLIDAPGASAVAVNSSGLVVGGFFRFDGTNTQFMDLGKFTAMDVNDQGVIAGSASSTVGHISDAATWYEGVTRAIQVYDTGNLGWRYAFAATAINSLPANLPETSATPISEDSSFRDSSGRPQRPT